MIQRNNIKSLITLVLFLLFILTTLVSGAEKPHPTLVNPDSVNCKTCHDDLANKKHVHGVLQDGSCDSCHEMKKVDNKTTVALAEEGNDLCIGCHSEIGELAEKKFPHAAVEEGCTTCHVPHSSDQPRLLADKIGTLCANCHDAQDEEFRKKHGRQPVDRLGCSPCHDPHGSDLEKMLLGKNRHVPFQEGECSACHKRARGDKIRLRGGEGRLCYACHSDKEEEFAKASIHGPVKKGECVRCHDPHMAQHKYMLKKEGNNLCLECHTDIKALLKSDNVHPPVEESCQNCHAPHASEHGSLLTEKGTALCLNCHEADAAFAAKHYNQKPEDLTCSECHNPHASKTEKLFNTHLHPPFAEKECESCHENGPKDKTIKLTADEVNDVCLACHDDKANDDSKKGMIAHGAIEGEGCTACHSAHAASRPRLLKNHTSRLCTTCHDDKAADPKGKHFMHPVIDSVGCEACHESHYGKNEKLLLEKPNKLCLECHLKKSGKKPAGDKTVTLFGKVEIKESDLFDYKKILLNTAQTRNHPQMGHIVSGEITKDSINNKRLKGLVFSGEMTCLSCHDAHMGASPSLFVDKIIGRFQLCLKCHIK